jgi:dTMP kinase
MPDKGIFITFEGPEGAGKTTQIKLLANYFQQNGIEYIITREPGGTGIAETLRELVKHHLSDEPIFPETELLLFAASRAQHVRHLIKPALLQGKVVLCDRFMDSTTAYQGYARGLDAKFIKKLNKFAVGDCLPNLTFLMDMRPEVGFKRAMARTDDQGKHDRLESEAIVFHHLVREGFLKIAAAEPIRVKIINAEPHPDQIHARILEYLQHAL